MLDVVGVKPQWGRGFTDADLRDDGSFAALIREDLARERFGSPQAALGKRLDATGRPLIVVGVMPDEFAFPSPIYRIWRLFEPGGPLTRNMGWGMVGRLANDLPIEQAMARVKDRAPVVGQSAAVSDYRAEVVPLFRTPTPAERRTLLLILIGAAICLLIVACANATSVELAAAVPRARTSAVQLALGASRSQLARVAALEGLLLIALSLASGLFLGWFLIPRLVESLAGRAATFHAEPHQPRLARRRVHVAAGDCRLGCWRFSCRRSLPRERISSPCSRPKSDRRRAPRRAAGYAAG